MMSTAVRLQQIKDTIPPHVTLVAVSKTHPAAVIQEAYSAGQRHFGENKVQELKQKAGQLPHDIVWHMIGHLQTNKVKSIVSFVGLIHSVDSFNLLMAINKEAKKANRVLDCLLQVHIARESTKFGFTEDELIELLVLPDFLRLDHIRICGLMGMATFTNDVNQVKLEFQGLKRLFDRIKQNYYNDAPHFQILSMGMSDDYHIAIGEGSTLIRVGSAIFGARDYR
jgi:PLP dependent protein